MKASEMTNEELANFFDELSSFNRDDDKFREAAMRLRNCEISKMSRDKKEEGHAPKTNEQKYKTAEERIKAFDKWCSNDCSSCPVGDKDDNVYHCMAYWLALEAEEEKPEPCPFCGHEMMTERRSTYGLVCKCCEYTTPFFDDVNAAIAVHNRVARAVRETNESKSERGER